MTCAASPCLVVQIWLEAAITRTVIAASRVDTRGSRTVTYAGLAFVRICRQNIHSVTMVHSGTTFILLDKFRRRTLELCRCHICALTFMYIPWSLRLRTCSVYILS